MKNHLFNRGFVSLIVTQFFGATNDNILKQVLIFMVSTGLWQNSLGHAGEAWITVFFTLPFIFFSGYGGQFADRYSKQRAAVILKILEIPIAAVAMAGLWMHSLPLTIAALVLLAIHSTFFGPVKYGMIPELVAPGDLSRANGSINMMTNIAVIMGTLLAGPISDRYFPTQPNPSGQLPASLPWLPGTALVIVATLGLISCLGISRLPARDPKLRFAANPMATYLKSITEMARSPLLMVALAWSFFYMIASTALLIVTHYRTILNINYTMNSYLLGALGLAIGVGCVLAGFISGNRIEPRLVPIGAIGMAVAFILLGLITPQYWSVGALLVTAGLFSGLYIVPLQSLLQKLSPDSERGRFLGTANAMSFVAFTIGAGVMWVATTIANLAPNRVFIVVAVITIIGTGTMLVQMRGLLRAPAAEPVGNST